MSRPLFHDGGPNPFKTPAERLSDVDVRPGRVARYRDGCELSLDAGEDPPETCPGENCDAALAGVLVPDGGLVHWREQQNTRQGGDGLPPTDHEGENVWLFTCVDCGRRWTDPLAPVVRCGCGGRVVAHQFDHDEYSRIRWYNDPREAAEVNDAQ